jgi:hypothetical protein
VDALNRIARDRFALDGRLTGPDLVAPGGRYYSAGDRVVTLAPAADGQVVTSERGEVVSIDVHRRALTVRMDDGRFERLEGDELAKDRLAYGYAITVHRAQASTVDVAHRFEDGGGRELGYVSMSRGRRGNTVHVVADNLDQAIEDLTREWAADHRPRWAIDSGTPATEPLAVEHHDHAPAGMRAALPHARLEAERRAVAAAIPPDRSAELAQLDRQLADLRRDRTDLLTGRGGYIGTPEGDAARQLSHARHQHRAAEHYADTSTSWRDRRHWRKEASHWAEQESAAETAYGQTVAPEARRIDDTIRRLEAQHHELDTARRERDAWLDNHPEAARRLRSLDRELNPLPEVILDLGRSQPAGLHCDVGVQPPSHGIELDFGP